MPLNALDHDPLSLFHPLTTETVVSGMSKELDMTYWLVVTLVTLPTISLAIHTPPQDVTIKKLPQGISTYSRDTIYSLKADWTVLVLLQKPTPDPRMFSILKSLRKIISHSNFTIDEAIKRNWIRRLRWLNIISIAPSKVSRVKRAPFSFIGSLSNILFGTVTETELRNYQQAVEMAIKSTNKTIHVTNTLITVTKNMQHVINENQHRISNLGSFLNNFTRRFYTQVHWMQKYMEKLSFQQNYEHLLISLEQASYFYTRQVDTYFRQCQSLERLQLTEDILPNSELGAIISNAACRLFHAPYHKWTVMD